MEVQREVQQQKVSASGVKLTIQENEQEVARVYIYILRNDLHSKPFALIEDLFVEESQRNKGYGTLLMNKALEVAKEKAVYKILATSRYTRENVHAWYKRLGFRDYGKEFRLDVT